MKITSNEILDALKDAMQKNPSGDGFTIRELRMSMGKGGELASEILVREGVRKLLQSGKATTVRLYRPAMDGILRNVSGYLLVKKNGKK